ncbi:MAG: hypothetical protein NC400_04210 [Clostridium sp.]|nr:hypothetical protein [Clostridium sp.]
MSGPKVDEAEVRRQEMMRLVEAREKRKNLANKIEKMLKQVMGCLASEISLMRQDELLGASCNRILAIKEECCRALQELLKEVKAGNESLDVEEISGRAELLVKKFNSQIQKEMAEVHKFGESSERYRQLEANRQQLEQARRRKIVRLSGKVQEAAGTDKKAIGLGQVAEGSAKAAVGLGQVAEGSAKEVEGSGMGTAGPDKEATGPVTDADVEELAEVFKEELGEFMKTEAMTGRHKNSMLLIYQDLQEILQKEIPAERKEKRIKRLFEDYQKMTLRIKNEMAEMEALYAEYLKECFDLTIPVTALSEFSSKAEIEEAIQTTKESAKANLSKEYIKRQIDEVMEKHGYNVVKSDLLAQANENGQILYGVNDNTAINVFVSDENQVTMRVVGIGFDTDISEAEDERLYQQQCAFCSMHPQITAELAMRGVILRTKKHMPPDKRFNKKLQTKSKKDSQTTSRAKKELKRTELKTMHKE